MYTLILYLPNLINYIHKNILPKRGGNQLTFASVCESKNIKTLLEAFLAPAKRALIKPCLFFKCIILTLSAKFLDTNLSNGFFKVAKKKK